MRAIRARLSYANVVATLALIVALGGTATAAIVITGANVKDNSLTGKDVRDKSLTSVDIRDRTLRLRDFAPAELPDPAKPNRGERGERGEAGPQGPNGPQGAGVSVRARSAEAPILGGSEDADVELSNSTWTQRADESALIWGQIVVDRPSTCVGRFEIQVKLDGDIITTMSLSSNEQGYSDGIIRLRFPGPGASTSHLEFEPGADNQRRLTFRASNTCGTTAEVRSVAINVAPLR